MEKYTIDKYGNKAVVDDFVIQDIYTNPEIIDNHTLMPVKMQITEIDFLRNAKAKCINGVERTLFYKASSWYLITKEITELIRL